MPGSNFRTIWTHLAIKHVGNFETADEEVSSLPGAGGGRLIIDLLGNAHRASFNLKWQQPSV
jgi:hypothetical protein